MEKSNNFMTCKLEDLSQKELDLLRGMAMQRAGLSAGIVAALKTRATSDDARTIKTKLSIAILLSSIEYPVADDINLELLYTGKEFTTDEAAMEQLMDSLK